MARGGRKKRRNFCFLSCFSDPSAWDHEELDFPEDNLPLTCLSRLRSLSKTVPVMEIAGDGQGHVEVLEEMQSEEASALLSPAGNQGNGFVQKFRKFFYEEKKKIKTTARPLAHTPLSAGTHNQQSVFCHVSTKFNYQSQNLAQIRTSHPRTPQSNRYAGLAPSPTPATHRLDLVTGLLVLSATLTVMLFFGRLCAVLCICAWFYLFSCIRKPLPAPPPETVIDGPEEVDVDVDSPEYKKKVVLMGLLERNRYGVSGMPMTPMASPATARMRSPW